MPPLIGIDRGLNGEALKALEESGHGRRLAIVDASYNIPRWAQVVDYRGESSAQALKGILDIAPVEGNILAMIADYESETTENDEEAESRFYRVVDDHPRTSRHLDGRYRLDEMEQEYAKDHQEDAMPGFYTIVNNEEDDTLFVRTPDRLPYACATFILGHSQTPEA